MNTCLFEPPVYDQTLLFLSDVKRCPSHQCCCCCSVALLKPNKNSQMRSVTLHCGRFWPIPSINQKLCYYSKTKIWFSFQPMFINSTWIIQTWYFTKIQFGNTKPGFMKNFKKLGQYLTKPNNTEVAPNEIGYQKCHFMCLYLLTFTVRVGLISLFQ